MFDLILTFLPESLILLGALVLFFVTLGHERAVLAHRVALVTSVLVLVAAGLSLRSEATLFGGAYRVDLFSQVLKLVFAGGFTALLLTIRLPDIPARTRPEYLLFLTLSVSGLLILVSATELITLVVALELASFPLYFLVAMRREQNGQRMQMESAIKYLMFGIAANGVMLFGLSYLFGLTGSTSLPEMAARFAELGTSPLALAGLALAFAGVYYKLAVFPFHFWTPDVYQGAPNETAALIASLPKVAAVAIMARFISLLPEPHPIMATMLTALALASMFYGNLLALGQRDLKRLLGFSAVAHAGYTLVGFVAQTPAGLAASLYYVVAYATMVLAVFVVIARVSRDGSNLALSDLLHLHRRAPLLAVTLLVGLFGLAGLPPFGGFMGKLSMLTAALAQGHLWLVIFTVLNAAIAIYYYLRIARDALFGNGPAAVVTPTDPILLDARTKALCVTLIVIILALGLLPSALLESLQTGVTALYASVP
jgi:NADH-quinone oxidoreductase subunit N